MRTSLCTRRSSRTTILRAVLDTLPVPHIFVVIDACFGDTFDPRIGESTHRSDGEEAISLEELRRRRMGLVTRQFLTSGSKEFVSDGRGENSPFARVFLQVLRSYGGDQHYLTIARHWRPQGDSNPRYRRERAMSWASRRWGLRGRLTNPIYHARGILPDIDLTRGQRVNWRFHVRKRELLPHSEAAALRLRRHQRDEGKGTRGTAGCGRSRNGKSGRRHTADRRG